jgi:hypothetical protein
MLNWGNCFGYAFGEDVPPLGNEKIIPLICPICGTHTDAEIKGRFECKENKYIKLPTSEMQVYNFFLRCTRCSGALLLMWSYGDDHHMRGISAGKIVFPFYTDAFEIESLNIEVIPKAIYEDIKQAELSFYSGAYLGSGLLYRRACQNICRDKECKGKNLVEEINDLNIKGIITKDMAEMAHSIRIIGNEIAHSNPSTPLLITRDDIRICHEFIKQLLQVIYINPYKANKIKESLKKRGL